MKHIPRILSAILPAMIPFGASAQILFLNGVSLPTGGEIVSYANGQILTTNSGGGSHAAQLYTLSNTGTLSTGLSIDFSSVFGGAVNINSISSVYSDSRGFGVATVIPTATGSTNFGRIALFNTSTGSILNTLDVGYHPDSVTITPDGTKLLIANEGEFLASAEGTFARPGSISVVDISGTTSGNFVSNIGGLTSANVATYDFGAANLGAGVTLTGIRDNTLTSNNTITTALMANIEPEYITATNTQAYITLQENNAIATFNFSTGKYEKITSLGAITQTVDASDRDGASNGKLISINDVVKGLPMPDTVTQFIRSGTTYLITANEGDARTDDGDIARGASSGSFIDTVNDGGIDVFYAGAVNNTGIGRLNILRDQGNLDGDAGIEDPTMMGTRSFSIWDAATHTLVFDSDSMIEQYVADNDPTAFNTNNGGVTTWDERSDDKGPEIEAIAFGSILGRDYVFVGAERQNGIFQFDITDLNNVTITNYFNTMTDTSDSGGAFVSPESIVFLSSASNPTGKNLLLVGFEGTGANGSIGVFEVVPEPHSTLLASLGAMLAFFRRRRH